MKSRSSHPEITLLLELIDQSYDSRAWHGTNLRGSLRRVTPEAAAWRPAPGRHNIWEIMIHTAYWKYTIRRRLLGEKRGSFPLKGSDWFVRPQEAGIKAWREDLALLDETHGSMRQAIVDLPAARLHRVAGSSKYTHAFLIYGIASHDLYHAGQIQLLKRLHPGE